MFHGSMFPGPMNEVPKTMPMTVAVKVLYLVFTHSLKRFKWITHGILHRKSKSVFEFSLCTIFAATNN